MVSYALYSLYIPFWVLFVSSTSAFGLRSDVHPFHAFKRLRGGGTLHSAVGSTSLSSTSINENYTFSVPAPRVIKPTLTSQGMVVSSIIPIFEVCNTPGSNTTSCSTVFETITTTSCSTVLTYAFTKLTISDCKENITFSTQSSYSLTSTIRPAITPAASVSSSSSLSLAPTTYVQSIVSYYVASWQSLASGTPSNVTLEICTSDQFEEESCVEIQEVWVVHTEYVPYTVNSPLAISTTFSSNVVLLLGVSQSVTAAPGPFSLSTQVEFPTISPNATTSISTIMTTSTTTSTITRTVTQTGDTITLTKTLSAVRESAFPNSSPHPESSKVLTTTISSTTQTTITVTVSPVTGYEDDGLLGRNSDLYFDVDLGIPALAGEAKVELGEMSLKITASALFLFVI